MHDAHRYNVLERALPVKNRSRSAADQRLACGLAAPLPSARQFNAHSRWQQAPSLACGLSHCQVRW
jgi:hypothetical protein